MIKLDKEDFETLYERAFLQRNDLVENFEGTDWIKSNLLGQITKDDLDNMR